MKHFLEKMRNSDWVWAEQYERTEEKDESMLMQDSIVFFVDNGTESMLAIFFNGLDYRVASNPYLSLTN
jgi:hypothetical protein